MAGDKSKDAQLLPGDVIYIPSVGPLVAVIGEREASDGTVQITDGNDGSRHTLPMQDLADKAATAHQQRSPINW